APPLVYARVWQAVLRNSELAFESSRCSWTRCFTLESILALSRLEYGLRQFADCRRAGRSTSEVFGVCATAPKIQPGESFSLSGAAVARRRGDREAPRGERSRMTDFLLVAWVSALIELRRFGWMFGLGRRWRRGEKLRLFFAGYNGTRNTGSDVRVQEMLRQIRVVLGAENGEFSVSSMSFDRTRGYFEETRQAYLPDTYPPFLFREVGSHHGVIACEGSMFKSKFANALTTFFAGALGLASAQNKLSLAYGAEAGSMEPLVQSMTARYVAESLVITRNPESQTILSELSISTELGTDRAWTFEPHPPEYGRSALIKSGWDGTTPILALCPIHPFVWPVRASIAKLAARTLTGAYRE